MSKPLVRFVQLLLCITLSMPLLAPAASAEDARSLNKVSGDVYPARSNHYYSLVVVTSAGVVVVDPINTTEASWLRENLGLITDKPITHLIYSHSHGDHASGVSALGAGTLIAQAECTRHGQLLDVQRKGEIGASIDRAISFFNRSSYRPALMRPVTAAPP